MHPETFIADMNGFSMDLEANHELVAAHKELIEALAQLEREVATLLRINKQIK